MRLTSQAIAVAVALSSHGIAWAQDDAGALSTDAHATAALPPATIIAINVDGAEVSINGTPIGKSPIAPHQLQSGDIIEVRKADFIPLRYEYDGRTSVALFLERVEPLEAPSTSSSDFPWLWVGVGAGALAVAAVVVIVAASAGGSSEPGIPIPEIE